MHLYIYISENAENVKPQEKNYKKNLETSAWLTWNLQQKRYCFLNYKQLKYTFIVKTVYVPSRKINLLFK